MKKLINTIKSNQENIAVSVLVVMSFAMMYCITWIAYIIQG